MNIYQMMSFEDAMKIEEFKRAYKMAMNPNNVDSINNVIDALFENVAFNYIEYRKQVPFVSANKESYKFHILQPVNGRYSLLDFLINRAFSNVDGIGFTKGNSFSTFCRYLCIDSKRYEGYQDKYPSGRIQSLYEKSMLHETGHALHGWDDHEDGKIHTYVDDGYSNSEKFRNEPAQNAILTQKIEVAEKLGLYAKYKNMLRLEDIRDIPQRIRFSLNSESFSHNIVNEAATEYFASKYSGLFDDIENYEYIDWGTYRMKVPSSTNGYQHSIRFIYHLENLVSKKSMFNSLFFADDEALEEFSQKYGHIVERVWERNSHIFPKDKSSTYSKVSRLFCYACLHESKDESQATNRLIAQMTLDTIFYETYKEEFEKGYIPKSKMMEIIEYSHELSQEVWNQSEQKWEDTKIRKAYGEWQRELNDELTQGNNTHNGFPTDPEGR